MRDRFVTGMITGGILGASAGMIAFASMNPKQRKRMMKRSSKMLRNMMGMAQAMHMMKSF